MVTDRDAAVCLFTSAARTPSVVWQRTRRQCARRQCVSRPVSRVLSGDPPIAGLTPRRPFVWDARCRVPRATNPGSRLDEPRCRSRLRHARRPYLVLLPVGFALPAPLPAPRCALTAPFHPCLAGAAALWAAGAQSAARLPCGQLKRERKAIGGMVSVALSLGLPPAAVSRHRSSMEPGLSSSGARGLAAWSAASGRPAG